MMFRRDGVTLMEIIVVIVILGVVLALSFPNYTVPTEQARALTAQNNLLAIYSAQKNYFNSISSSSSYCTVTTGNVVPCGDNLADLNTNLSLNIQDDGTYSYSCSSAANTCTATRNTTLNTIVLTLTSPVNLSGTGTANPVCNLTSTWCPS